MISVGVFNLWWCFHCLGRATVLSCPLQWNIQESWWLSHPCHSFLVSKSHGLQYGNINKTWAYWNVATVNPLSSFQAHKYHSLGHEMASHSITYVPVLVLNIRPVLTIVSLQPSQSSLILERSEWNWMDKWNEWNEDNDQSIWQDSQKRH